jgi:hypothetical protein
MADHLVAGLGEVGTAMFEVLSTEYDVDGVDPGRGINGCSAGAKVLHVCFGHHDKFVDAVQMLQARFKPELTIVHSTVPVGTTAKIPDAVHSPIRGVHPNLAAGIRLFPKHFGGPRAKEAAAFFRDLGIDFRTYDDSRITEALKLWDTTQYGWMIILEKEMHAWCEEIFGEKALEVMDRIYRQANAEYNEVYRDLGRPEVARPMLKHQPGPIGGHCVMPNADLLEGAPISGVLKLLNSMHQGEE